jgi:hypothetical protein
LLGYALAAAGVIWVARRIGALNGPPVSPWLLIFAPPVWLVATNLLILTKAPSTDALVNDSGAPLKWLGLFVTGPLAAATVLLAIQSRVNDRVWSAVSGLYAWAAICTLCGFAKAAVNRPSPLLSCLNEAVLPIYVLHQPMLLVAAFWLFPLHLPVPVEVILLTVVTGLGSLVI